MHSIVRGAGLPDVAAEGRVDPLQGLEQGALACAVAADDHVECAEFDRIGV